MKRYILKYDVYNNVDFPKGTTVIITDDYWGDKRNDSTGFTVIKGKLKGEKGCVADGLNGWLLDDTPENKKLIKNHENEITKLENSIKRLNKKWDSLPTVKI